ncbi:MAG: pallilysin-related adhesin [Treponema sp.]|jgi:hypothetical protein|nr:pallilysin-related adhesin [Treponema sp.]
MMIKISKLITIMCFLAATAVIVLLVFFPDTLRLAQEVEKPKEIRQTRVIERHEAGSDEEIYDDTVVGIVYNDNISAKIPLEDWEILAGVLNENFDADVHEEQILAYRNLADSDSRIYIAYVDFDEIEGVYKRMWDAKTLATRPGTLELYTLDMVGDRVPCVIVRGMNGGGEHTLTAFRWNQEAQPEDSPATATSAPVAAPFDKIAEIQIDGVITIQSVERTQAYQLGLSNGKDFPIAAYGRDAESLSILDQVEITYTYNAEKNEYEQSGVTRVPGRQVEERRVREILSGGARGFEAFITGLWYFVRPDGAIDSRQYIYFDPFNKEVIFYTDETQQVFTWQNSGATRYGLYISTQNISVQTLRRSVDIALESLESIRVKVFEDVRLKIGNDAGWDGSYRKATAVIAVVSSPAQAVPAHINAVYNGIIGRIRFSTDGMYEITLGGVVQNGRYSFYTLNDLEVLELRHEDNSRETYTTASGTDGTLSLKRVRIGANGVQDLHEPAILLLREENS